MNKHTKKPHDRRMLCFSVRFVRYLAAGAIAIVCSAYMIPFSSRIDLQTIYKVKFKYFRSSTTHGLYKGTDKYTIQTKGCTIPALQAFDDSIKDFVVYPSNISPCPDSSLALLNNNKTHIWVVKNNKKLYNVKNNADFLCYYKSFHRPNAIIDITSDEVDKRVVYSRRGIYFRDAVKVRDEFVRVICSVKHIIVYKQFYIFAVKKQFLSHYNEMPRNGTGFNVLVLGIDGVSRLNFHRTMPKTLQYLTDNGAVELLGYNKVGDNTFPNLIPMLLGVKESELKKTCIPYKSAMFDNCPFVWELYKEAGYYTAFGEDSSGFATFRTGFAKTPTDYYFRTFINEAEAHIAMNKPLNFYLCLNEKWTYKYLLNYISDLTNVLLEDKLFGFFWEMTMSHDYVNYPMVMDDVYLNFFKKLHNSRYFNKTILFLVSDHGLRWGYIRSTKQGRLEESLPFVYILLPKTFQEIYSNAFANLKVNRGRLTTPFDVHETLVDLADLSSIENKAIAFRSSKSYAHDRGISLFLPVPENRTCELADIADHWCTCHKEIELPINSTKAHEGANHLIGHINNMIKSYPQCAKLVIKRTLKVMEAIVGKADDNENGWTELVVTIQASPGNGVFEGTLRNNSQGWSISGTISRINLYGTQSHCVSDAELKLYCFCKKTF